VICLHHAFIGALNRFFDRRGKSSVIYSDNGTNFVGANHKLRVWSDLFQAEQHKKSIDDFFKTKGRAMEIYTSTFSALRRIMGSCRQVDEKFNTKDIR